MALGYTIIHLDTMLSYLRDKFYHYFLAHPEEVCMTYKSHLLFAMQMAGLHLYGAAVSTVHALFPKFFPKTVTKLNHQIAAILREAGCKGT